MDDALEADDGKQPAGESAQPRQQQHGKSDQTRVAGRLPIVYLARSIHFFIRLLRPAPPSSVFFQSGPQQPNRRVTIPTFPLLSI